MFECTLIKASWKKAAMSWLISLVSGLHNQIWTTGKRYTIMSGDSPLFYFDAHTAEVISANKQASIKNEKWGLMCLSPEHISCVERKLRRHKPQQSAKLGIIWFTWKSAVQICPWRQSEAITTAMWDAKICKRTTGIPSLHIIESPELPHTWVVTSCDHHQQPLENSHRHKLSSPTGTNPAWRVVP